MAKIQKRIWTSRGPTGHKVKKVAWGYTAMVLVAVLSMGALVGAPTAASAEGWYLLMPPINLWTQAVDASSPLSVWQQYSVHDSARDCEDERLLAGFLFASHDEEAAVQQVMRMSGKRTGLIPGSDAERQLTRDARERVRTIRQPSDPRTPEQISLSRCVSSADPRLTPRR